MRGFRLTAMAALGLLVCTTVTACTEMDGVAEIRPADVVGIWASDRGGRLTLEGGYTFKAEELNVELMSEGRVQPLDVTEKGTWALSGEGRLTGVLLKFSSGATESLTAYRRSDQLQLVYYVGLDPDSSDWYVFRSDSGAR